jgi:two-component system response regulator GlrR
MLKLTAGNVADAARLAQRNRTEFYRLLQKHGLVPQRYRGEPGAEATEAVSGFGDSAAPPATGA